MAYKKIDLNDLTILPDGTNIDIGEITEKGNPEYALLKEEVDDFLQKPKEKVKKPKNSFFENVPETALKKSIENILKVRNTDEERMRKHIQFEYDLKMSRINKIKSKSYRRIRKREKIRKEMEISLESSEYQKDSEENEEERIPIMDFVNENKDDDSEGSEISIEESKKLVKLAFQTNDEDLNVNELEFIKQKAETVESEAPQIIETVLPGWNTWAGTGIETVKNKHNTFIETKEGIKPIDRKDFNRKHLIINENTTIPDKYKCEIPYGYSQENYHKKLSTPISLETNSLRVFKRFVKMEHKEDNPAGKKIKPAVFDPNY